MPISDEVRERYQNDVDKSDFRPLVLNHEILVEVHQLRKKIIKLDEKIQKLVVITGIAPLIGIILFTVINYVIRII